MAYHYKFTPLAISDIDNELDAKLQHSYDQSLRGEGRPFEDVFDDLERGCLMPSYQVVLNKGKVPCNV